MDKEKLVGLNIFYKTPIESGRVTQTLKLRIELNNIFRYMCISVEKKTIMNSSKKIPILFY